MRIFDIMTGKFYLRYKDRESAGNILGEALKDLIKKEDRKNCIVLGIPRGGVITAYYIARKLGCQFDILISRKLCAPGNEEFAIGAVTEYGAVYLNDKLIKELDITSDYIEKEKFKQLNEIKRRNSLYRIKNNTIEGGHTTGVHKTVILADDGTATGATFIAAKRSVKRVGIGGLIVMATPVAPKSTIALLKNEGIEHIEVITSFDDSDFKSVENYYDDFHQLTDQEVIDVISRE